MPSQSHQGQVAGTHWNPLQYLKFSDHRLRPALELLDRVPLTAPDVVYDLGCGPGGVTRIIQEKWPSSTIYGLDNSAEMLRKAAAKSSQIHWVEADVASWSPDEGADLIYANATLQWLNNHHELFPRLVGFLNPGGCLAVQMPLSWGMPSHRLMRETLANGSINGSPMGTENLRQAVSRKWVEDAETYYDLLVPHSISLDIWETQYLQVLEGEDPVLEWVTGTGLRPILNGLDDAERETFLTEYAQRLRQAYPQRTDGRTFYPFRRLFMVITV